MGKFLKLSNLRILRITLIAFIIAVLCIPSLPLFHINLFDAPVRAAPADAYWVGNGGSWSDSTNHWATSSNGTPNIANLPDQTTHVHFDANSFTLVSQKVYIDADAYCNDMIWSSVYGIPDLTGNAGSGSQELYIYGSLTLDANMTFTAYWRFATVVFKAGATGKTITTNGIAIPPTLTFDSAAGGWTFQDAVTTGGLTLSAGALDTNDKAVTINSTGEFTISGATSRSLDLGSSIITISNGTNYTWNASTTTNLTFTAGTSSIRCNFAKPFQGGGLTYYEVQLNSADMQVYYANTFTNLIATGTNTATDTFIIGANQVITGALTLSGYSQGHRLLVKSDTRHTPRTLTVTGATVTGSSNVDFRDITMTPAQNLSAITGYSGNCGGNTGITFTTATTVYAVGGTGNYNWSDSTKWASSTGGVGGSGRVPLPQDMAVFDANSVVMPGINITLDALSLSGINANAVTTDPTFTATNGYFYNSLNIGTVCTWTVTNTYMYGQNGQTMSGGFGATNIYQDVQNTGGSITLAANLTTTGTYYHLSGATNTANYNFTIGKFDSDDVTYSRSLALGSSIVTLTGIGAVWDANLATSFSLYSQTSSLVIDGSTNDARTFDGGGLTYYDITIEGSGNFTTTMGSAFTAHNFTIDRDENAKTITGNYGITLTGGLFIPVFGDRLVFIGTTDFSKASGIVVTDYLSFTAGANTSVATGGATPFLAGSHSLGSPQTGWSFTDSTNPVVSAMSADTVSRVDARLRGSIDSLGSYTSGVYAFTEWGTTVAYEICSSANVTEQFITATGTVVQVITGLTYDTTYHFRIGVRYNGTEYIYTDDGYFTTLGAPTVTTLDATDIDATTVTLNGLMDSGDYASVSVYFEWTTDAYYDAHGTYEYTTPPQTFDADSGFSQGLTGLVNGVQYHFRAVAQYGAILIVNGSDKTFTTSAASGQSSVIMTRYGAVFSGYLETGDLLFVAEVINTYTDYYPDKDSRKYFQIQLIGTDNTTILAATPLWDYGCRPVSIYLDEDVAEHLTEGSAYKIRMIGLFASPPVDDYQLQPEDWHGVDLVNLDQWMLRTAFDMNTYYKWTLGSVNYTLNFVTDQGLILSEKGGAYFTEGIPGVSNIRPDVFAQPKSKAGIITTHTADNVFDRQTWVSGAIYAIDDKVGYANTVYQCLAVTGAGDVTAPSLDAVHWVAVAGEIWEAQVGTKLAADAHTFGDLFGIDGDIWLGFGIWLIIILITLYGLSHGTGALGMVLVCFPLILLGNYFRVIGIQVTVVTAALMVFLFVRQFWFKST